MNNKAKFDLYAQLLREWSKKMNLVAPSTLTDIYNRHFADCAQLADVLPRDAKIVDLGSGAGFPAAVLAIMGWNVVAIESIGKKVAFLTAVKENCLYGARICTTGKNTGLCWQNWLPAFFTKRPGNTGRN